MMLSYSLDACIVGVWCTVQCKIVCACVSTNGFALFASMCVNVCLCVCVLCVHAYMHVLNTNTGRLLLCVKHHRNEGFHPSCNYIYSTPLYLP